MSEEQAEYRTETAEAKIERSAVALLDAVWRAIEFDKWDRRKIWGIFERRVKSCAFQNLYPKTFYQQLCTKMRVPSGSGIDVSTILTKNNREVVDYIRENTALCVMILRVQRQEIKNEYKI